MSCFLASGHLCSCLYNSSARRAGIKTTLFPPLPRLLFSIVLHLSPGKHRLETLSGWGGNWIQVLCFLGKSFKYWVNLQRRGTSHPTSG